MLKLRVWTCTGPPPNDWELPLPAAWTNLAALSDMSVCALRMSSMFQYMTGGASGARGGCFGGFEREGVISAWGCCALALGNMGASKWALRRGWGNGLGAEPGT